MSTQAQPVEQNENDVSSLIATADAVFGRGVREFPLADGFMVQIRPANLGSISTIVKVFTRLMEQFNENQMRQLVDMASDAQMLAIAQGKDPKNADIDYNALVSKAFGSSRVIETVFLGIMSEMPEIVATFTNIPAERVNSLELDEGILVVGGIFTLNYGFFTQRALPILTSLVGRIARAKLAEKPSKKPAPAQKLAQKESNTAKQSKPNETE